VTRSSTSAYRPTAERRSALVRTARRNPPQGAVRAEYSWQRRRRRPPVTPVWPTQTLSGFCPRTPPGIDSYRVHHKDGKSHDSHDLLLFSGADCARLHSAGRQRRYRLREVGDASVSVFWSYFSLNLLQHRPISLRSAEGAPSSHARVAPPCGIGTGPPGRPCGPA